MKKSHKKITLRAGEYFFGQAGTHVHTLLGSCISITLWHPQLHIGGMCHFVLPRHAKRENGKLDPRYAEDCLALFKRSTQRHKTHLKEYQAKIFGGGNMRVVSSANIEKLNSQHFDLLNSVQNSPIGDKNAMTAYHLLASEEIEIQVAHVGEFGYRYIVFDIENGDVWVRYRALSASVQNMQSLNGPI